MKLNVIFRTSLLLGLALAMILAGCSSNSPTAIDNPADRLGEATENQTFTVNTGNEGGQFQFAATVMTTDRNQRMLTFNGRPDTVFALQNCEIVRMNNGNETPIPFEDINNGDSVGVYGTTNQFGYTYAFRLRVYNGSDCDQYDLSFRDTVTEIDYEGGWFKVAGRTETITVDEFTYVWAATHNFYGGNSAAYKGGVRFDSTLTFTDVMIGDVVEVKADIIDEVTLYAAKIQLPGINYQQCISFDDILISIDLDNRIVLFNQQAWIGYVCPKAQLSDESGEPITLEDFAIDDLVYVKGRAVSDTLKICQMEKIEN